MTRASSGLVNVGINERLRTCRLGLLTVSKSLLGLVDNTLSRSNCWN